MAQARAEAARARDRAAELDSEARNSTIASERAILAAAVLAARVQQGEAALASADAELGAVRAQRRELDRRLARERAPVAQLLAGLQTQVRRPALLTLIQPGSIQDAVHLRAVVAAVEPQIVARTAALKNGLERVRSMERRAASLVADRRALQAELVARRRDLGTLAAAERLKARRAGEAADREAERAFAIAEQTRDLSTLVRKIEVASPAGTARPGPDPDAERSGPDPYRLPTAGPFAGVGAGPANRIAILARPNALVIAPGAGRVAFAGPYRGYGEIVIVEHAGGWTSLITGLATAQVAVGQTLVAGSPLGQAPPSDPRIGLELRENGRRVNPLDQLR